MQTCRMLIVGHSLLAIKHLVARAQARHWEMGRPRPSSPAWQPRGKSAVAQQEGQSTQRSKVESMRNGGRGEGRLSRDGDGRQSRRMKRRCGGRQKSQREGKPPNGRNAYRLMRPRRRLDTSEGRRRHRRDNKERCLPRGKEEAVWNESRRERGGNVVAATDTI